MTSPIGNWFSSWFRSNSTTTPATDSTHSKTSQKNFLLPLLGEKSLAVNGSPPTDLLSSKKIQPLSPSTSTDTQNQLVKVTAEIDKLSRSWFSFLYKGRIQTLQTRHTTLQEQLKQEKLQEAKLQEQLQQEKLQEAKLQEQLQQEKLQEAKEVFSTNFQTSSKTASDCARSLHEIYLIDPREAATLFLSKAQSNAERAAAILLAAKTGYTTVPQSKEKKFISSLISSLDASLSLKQVKTLSKIFQITLEAEIPSQLNESLFRADGPATIPLFRCIAHQVLSDALSQVSVSQDSANYWKNLSESLGKKPLNKESHDFFLEFRNAIQEKINVYNAQKKLNIDNMQTNIQTNRMLLSILTNRVLGPSIMLNKTLCADVMKSVVNMDERSLEEICNKLTGLYEDFPP